MFSVGGALNRRFTPHGPDQWHDPRSGNGLKNQRIVLKIRSSSEILCNRDKREVLSLGGGKRSGFLDGVFYRVAPRGRSGCGRGI
jgi:hypothetical protein